MNERIASFNKGDRPGASRLNELVEGINELRDPPPGRPELFFQKKQTTFVKILENAPGDEWYYAEVASGSLSADGTEPLDLSADTIEFEDTANCLVLNEAADGETGHSLETGTIMRGFFCGISKAGGGRPAVAIFSVNPGGAPAAEFPTPSYTGQVYQAVTDNVAAWQFPVSHTIP